MFYKLVKQFESIIKEYKIKDYVKFGTAQKLIAEIKFIDDSVLYIKEYIFTDGRRKYAFHWQNKKGQMIIRWDNSPHHSYLKTFPHHKHLGGEIQESKEIYLPEIFNFTKEFQI